jgi:hypothetical protein
LRAAGRHGSAQQFSDLRQTRAPAADIGRAETQAQANKTGPLVGMTDNYLSDGKSARALSA